MRKRVFFPLAILASTTISIMAQDFKDGGYIFTFVVSGTEKTQISIDGYNPKSAGFDTGWTSSFIIVPFGIKMVSAWAGEVKSDPTPVTVSKTCSPVVVVGRDEKQNRSDPTANPLPILRIASVGNLSDGGGDYQGIYASPKADTEIQIDGETFKLSKWKPETLGSHKGSVTISKNGKVLGKISPQEQSHFLIVFYDDAHGDLKFTAVPEALFTR